MENPKVTLPVENQRRRLHPPLASGGWAGRRGAGCIARIWPEYPEHYLSEIVWARGSLRSSSCLGRKPPRAPQLEETPETPPSMRDEGLLFLPGLESNPESSLQTEEEARHP